MNCSFQDSFQIIHKFYFSQNKTEGFNTQEINFKTKFDARCFNHVKVTNLKDCDWILKTLKNPQPSLSASPRQNHTFRKEETFT